MKALLSYQLTMSGDVACQTMMHDSPLPPYKISFNSLCAKKHRYHCVSQK